LSAGAPTVDAALVPAAEAGSSLWRDAWRRLAKNRAALVSGAILVLLILGCVLVPELSPWGYALADLATEPILV